MMNIDFGNDVQKEGWLHKRGEHIKTWRARYFVLKKNGDFLGFNFMPSKNDVPNNTFCLKKCQIVISDKQRMYSFVLKIQNSEEKSIERFFAAYSSTDRSEWISAIRSVAQNITENFTIDLVKSKIDKIELDDFEYLKIIGKGHFGKVVLTREKTSDQILAMKILKKNLIIEQNKIAHIKAENFVLKSLRHPFITSLVYAFQTRDLLCLAMEYVSGGDLFYHLVKEGKFSEHKSNFYSAEISYAIGYLHSKDIIYRDLKLENILLDVNGHVKLTDFGLCKRQISHGCKTSTFCGTIEYLAPEMIQKEIADYGYTRCVDWWALGVLLYEMLTGRLPFRAPKNNNIDNRKILFDSILNKKLDIPFDLRPETKILLAQLLEKEPCKRIGSRFGFDEIKNHAYFANIDWDKLEKRELEPPFVPMLFNETDTSNFDREFTSETVCLSPVISSYITKNYFDSFSYYGSRSSLISKSSSIRSRDKFDLSVIIDGEQKIGVESFQEKLNKENALNFEKISDFYHRPLDFEF